MAYLVFAYLFSCSFRLLLNSSEFDLLGLRRWSSYLLTDYVDNLSQRLLFVDLIFFARGSAELSFIDHLQGLNFLVYTDSVE